MVQGDTPEEIYARVKEVIKVQSDRMGPPVPVKDINSEMQYFWRSYSWSIFYMLQVNIDVLFVNRVNLLEKNQPSKSMEDFTGKKLVKKGFNRWAENVFLLLSAAAKRFIIFNC